MGSYKFVDFTDIFCGFYRNRSCVVWHKCLTDGQTDRHLLTECWSAAIRDW